MRDNWYHHWVAGATLDDQLWYQALVMDRVLESLRGSEQGPNDAMMWTLLRRGVIDADVVDKPWNGSTRSMRYSAVLVGRLWGLLAGERTRVSLHSLFQLSQTEPWLLPREIGCVIVTVAYATIARLLFLFCYVQLFIHTR